MGYLSKQPAMDLSTLSTLISENYAARADAPRCRSCQCKMRLSDSGERKPKTFYKFGSRGRIRTYDQSVNSRPLYH